MEYAKFYHTHTLILCKIQSIMSDLSRHKCKRLKMYNKNQHLIAESISYSLEISKDCTTRHYALEIMNMK